MKYILTENNYFSHIGTDPVSNSVALEDDKNFSFENQPTRFHLWNGDEFVLDTQLYKDNLIEQVQQSVFDICDDLQNKILKNESYYYADDYQNVKDSLINNIKTQRARINTFANLTIEELEQFIAG